MAETASGGRTWWAHFEFTRINIEPIILRKKIEERWTVGTFPGIGTGSGATRIVVLLGAWIRDTQMNDPRRSLTSIFIASDHRVAPCSGRPRS